MPESRDIAAKLGTLLMRSMTSSVDSISPFYPNLDRNASRTSYPPLEVAADHNPNMDREKRPLRDVLADNVRRHMQKDPGQKRLEKKSGVSQATISRILKGSDDPSSITLKKLEGVAEALGCEVWELLIDDETVRQTIVNRFLRGSA